jgi:hypothetical protein
MPLGLQLEILHLQVVWMHTRIRVILIPPLSIVSNDAPPWCLPAPAHGPPNLSPPSARRYTILCHRPRSIPHHHPHHLHLTLSLSIHLATRAATAASSTCNRTDCSRTLGRSCKHLAGLRTNHLFHQLAPGVQPMVCPPCPHSPKHWTTSSPVSGASGSLHFGSANRPRSEDVRMAAAEELKTHVRDNGRVPLMPDQFVQHRVPGR